MKHALLLLVFSFSLIGFSQGQELNRTLEDDQDQDSKFEKCLDLTVGYVFKDEYNAAKVSFMVNNIFLTRFGVYTSLENGLNSDYFSNTWGITGTISKTFYLYGGIDLFSKTGLFTHDADHGIRKEFGLGITPYKWLVVSPGWSSEVGLTLSAGVRFTL